MLKNPYTRIAIAAALSTLITPRIINAVMVPELTPGNGLRNEAMAAGVCGATTAAIFVILSMAIGPVSAA